MSYTQSTTEAGNNQAIHHQVSQQGQLGNHTVSLIDPSKEGRSYAPCFITKNVILTGDYELLDRVSLAWEDAKFGGVAELIYCLVRILVGTLELVKTEPLPSQNPQREPQQPVAVIEEGSEEESEETDIIPTHTSPVFTQFAPKPVENETELKIKQLEAEKAAALSQWDTEMTKYDGIVKQRQERRITCEERLENLRVKHDRKTKKWDTKIQKLKSLASEIEEAQNAINKIDEEQLRQAELEKIEKGESKGAMSQQGVSFLDRAFGHIGKKTTFQEEREQQQIQKNAAIAPRACMKAAFEDGKAKKKEALEQVKSEIEVIESTIKSLNDQMTKLQIEIAELPDKNQQNVQIPNARQEKYLAIEKELDKLKQANAKA